MKNLQKNWCEMRFSWPMKKCQSKIVKAKVPKSDIPFILSFNPTRPELLACSNSNSEMVGVNDGMRDSTFALTRLLWHFCTGQIRRIPR